MEHVNKCGDDLEKAVKKLCDIRDSEPEMFQRFFDVWKGHKQEEQQTPDDE
jgi:hypothetical protein